MESAQALKLLTALSNGINPITAEAFPAESPYQHPDIVRALFQAVRALEAQRDQPPVNPSTVPSVSDHPSVSVAPATADSSRAPNRPGKAGKPWSQPEDDELLAAYDAGQTIEVLAQAHQRSRLGIEARLARYGRVPMPAGVRSTNGQRRPTIPESDPHAPMSGAPHAPSSYMVRDAARGAYGMHA